VTYFVAACSAIEIVEPEIGACNYAIIKRTRAIAFAGITFKISTALKIQAGRVPSKPFSIYHSKDQICPLVTYFVAT
jgi:hypothetical protein